jgi:RimJ/RimL family protein N-acetyltransferase
VRAPGPELRTERLLLRRWHDSDRDPFAALNADPVVMEHFPGPLKRQESDAFVDRMESHFAQHGFSMWALEVVSTGSFAGFVGLLVPRFEAHFTPAVEIGWRLARQHWGLGYATEAAHTALAFGFEEIRLDEIVAYTVPENVRSRRVMERLGMARNPADDFENPVIPEGHRLRRHVLYRVSRGSLRQALGPREAPPSRG